MFKKGKFIVCLGFSGFLLLLGCGSKDQSKTPPANIKKESVLKQKHKNKFFEIELVYKVSADDVFQVFYTSLDADEKFSQESSIKGNVVPSEEFNMVTFKLPKNILPYKLRIDLGEQISQSEIYIKEMNLKYDGNEIQIKPDLIPRLFSINEFIDFNSKTGKFIFSEVSGRYDPFIISSPLLNKKIEMDL